MKYTKKTSEHSDKKKYADKENTLSTQETPDKGKPDQQGDTPKKENAASFWRDRQHRDLVFYLSIGIFFLEMVVGGIAFFYGIIHATPGVDGGPPQFQFPWLAYIIAAIVAPAALILIVHMAGVGLFRTLKGKDAEEEAAWQATLPKRVRKVYTFISGAPTMVLLLGLLLCGVALFYVDGAMDVLLRVASRMESYLPWIVGGLVIAWCVAYMGRVWFSYRTRRMEEEFAFRRQIFETTGQIIVDKNSRQLPPVYEDAPKALEGAPSAMSDGAAPLENADAHAQVIETTFVVHDDGRKQDEDSSEDESVGKK